MLNKLCPSERALDGTIPLVLCSICSRVLDPGTRRMVTTCQKIVIGDIRISIIPASPCPGWMKNGKANKKMNKTQTAIEARAEVATRCRNTENNIARPNQKAP